MIYTKKAQVLFTEKQFADLTKIASKLNKKMGAIIRDAVEEVYLKKQRKKEIANAVDRLLSMPETPSPKNYQQWEKEYSKLKQPCDTPS